MLLKKGEKRTDNDMKKWLGKIVRIVRAQKFLEKMKIRKNIKKSTEKLVSQNSQNSQGSKVSREMEYFLIFFPLLLFSQQTFKLCLFCLFCLF